MHSARFGVLVSILLLNVPVWARQAQTPTTPSPDQTATTPTPALKDPQAVSVVTQALAAAGGIPAITAITDYTATGNASYFLDAARSTQATVTVRGKGLGQFRIDTNLPSGTRSESTNGFTTIK